jgi:hypothetical protein
MASAVNTTSNIAEQAQYYLLSAKFPVLKNSL